jgi:hypothetical protein
MGNDLAYRGYNPSVEDIQTIENLIKENPDSSRRQLSIKLAELWNWRQLNGALLDRKCRGVLLVLERAEVIKLPPPTHMHTNNFKSRAKNRFIEVETKCKATSLKELGPLTIKEVRRSKYEVLCDSLIEQYHYLHFSQPVGEHLKYIFFSQEEKPLGVIIFTSAPRHIGARDKYIGWNAETRRKNIHLLAYNTRFLILPWVHIPHLASHILGTIAHRIGVDWQKHYKHPIYFLETFVDTERFAGTCYKAANWQYLGLTKGLGKNSKTKQPDRSIKAVWGYPLVKDFQRRLCHG